MYQSQNAEKKIFYDAKGRAIEAYNNSKLNFTNLNLIF